MFDGYKSKVFNRQLKMWEKKRRHGKQAFIFYKGVLRWGGIMFALTTFTNVYGRHMKLDWLSEVSLLIACLLAGYVWARCVWHVNENRFRDAIEQRDSIKAE